MHNQAPIQRRKSTRIYVGNVPIGDGAPIAVQSMTNTRTTDVEATVNQIKALERVGADIVRVSVPTMDAAEAFKLIKQQVNVPLRSEERRVGKEWSTSPWKRPCRLEIPCNKSLQASSS